MVRNLPAGEVSLALRAEERDVELTAGSARFHLRTLPAEDFPRLPELEEEAAKLPPQPLAETIDRVARAASRDEVRPILTGVLVQVEGATLTMVATDSYRLSVKHTELEQALPEPIEANVPARALRELARIIAQEEPGRGGDLAGPKPGGVPGGLGGAVLAADRGAVPELAPADPGVVRARGAAAAGRSCVEVARRVSQLAQRNAPLRFAFAEGELTVAAETPEVGDASEALPAPYSGEPLEIAFNPQFLIEGLESVEGDELAIKLSSPLRPGLLAAGRPRGLQLPRDADPAQRLRSRVDARRPRLQTLGFRNLAAGRLGLGEGVTLLWGPNGAGKTNVLEAICLALSGRSCRTRNERETIAFGEPLARIEAEVMDGGGDARSFLWSLDRSGERRHLVDGSPAGAEHAELRPPLAIFLPDRLALVKGPPGLRRAHLDRLCAALWPARAEARRRYGRALAQRNALLGRIRSGAASVDSLAAWDRELAAMGVELIESRREAVDLLAAGFARQRRELCLPGAAELRYLPRSEADDPESWPAELRERHSTDLARGYTSHGPHLDELAVTLGGRPLRRYGSQGEQRTAVLALLFAERRALLEAGRSPPLMLLDDVMSELDSRRRAQLAKRLAEGGQAVLTATEPDHLPGGCERAELALRQGEAPSPKARRARRRWRREPSPLAAPARRGAPRGARATPSR